MVKPQTLNEKNVDLNAAFTDYICVILFSSSSAEADKSTCLVPCQAVVLNEILHMQHLACFKCSINVDLRCYWVFEPSFLLIPVPSSPILGKGWVSSPCDGNSFIYLCHRVLLRHLHAQCSRNGREELPTSETPEWLPPPLAVPFLFPQ